MRTLQTFSVFVDDDDKIGLEMTCLPDDLCELAIRVKTATEATNAAMLIAAGQQLADAAESLLAIPFVAQWKSCEPVQLKLALEAWKKAQP